MRDKDDCGISTFEETKVAVKGTRKQPTRSPREPSPIDIQNSLTSRGKSLVFISHDSRDGELAEAFATMLTSVSAGMLKSFRSSDKKGSTGIGFGEEWYTTIMARLEDATDVVALLTSQSVDRPWILYEAGVAKGKLNTTVLGIALGVPLDRVSTGPFGQFQNCGDDEDSLTALVLQLLSRNPDASPLEEAVRMQVRLFNKKVLELLSKRGGTSSRPVDDEQSAAKLFEEVKAMVRELPDRLEVRMRDTSRGRPIRKYLLGPKMLEELLMGRLSDGIFDQSVAWLVLVSLLRDDLPWLYETGMDVYRAMRGKSNNTLQQAINSFIELTQVTFRSGLFRDFVIDDKSAYAAWRHLPDLVEVYFLKLMHNRRGTTDPTKGA